MLAEKAMPKRISKIGRYVCILIMTVISAEYMVMLMLDTTGASILLPREIEAVLDALLIVVLSAAPTYFFIIKPIIKETLSYTDELKKLVTALDASGEAVIITDADGSITYVNEVFTDITGYTFDEVIGRNPRILQSGRQSKAFYQMMWRSIVKTGEWQGELWNKCKDGRVYPERLHIKSILGGNGKVKFYICNFADITEQQEQEKLLRQAQKMDAIGNLVAGVAHNFNNVLAAITGNTYLAKKSAVNLKTIDYLKCIEKSSQEAAVMVKQLLSFSHAGVQQKAPMHIVDLTLEAVNTAKLGIREDIKVTTRFTPEPLIVFCDAVDIQQALINLINNARDALEGSEERAIKVSVEHKMRKSCSRRITCDDCSLEVVHLVVQDTGSGISETDLLHIFDPFFTTKPLGGGTGLGLSMAKGTVESHGGSFHVSSELGVGSRFEICLPLTSAVLQIQEAQEKREPRESRCQETILVIDDEAMVRLSLEKLLQSLGYQVLTAADGEDGLQVFLENADDIVLVVSDVVMPRLDGPAAVLKMRVKKPSLPVLFVTGYNDKEIKVGEQTKVVSKPFRIVDLSYDIEALIYP